MSQTVLVCYSEGMPDNRGIVTATLPPLLVIFGITGDLAKRYLLPALYRLIKEGALDPEAEIIGITRQDLTTQQLLDRVDLCVHDTDKTCDPVALEKLKKQTRLIQMDPSDPVAYLALLHAMNAIEEEKGICMNRLYYLSIPPQLYRPIIKHMGRQGLNTTCQHGQATTRIVVEKPFGYDLQSAEKLINETASVFEENQIFRVDHFLAKQSVQDILRFRIENPLLETIWNTQHIASIDITASEQISIEGRAQFYDSLGALRDFIQNHLLQLLGIVGMERPPSLDSDQLHTAKQNLLEAVLPVSPKDIGQRTLRGQYESYRQEVENPDSTTETYADISLFIGEERWQDVPFRLWTGKAMAEKKYEIRITFRDKSGAGDHYLRFRIQPAPTIELNLPSQLAGFDKKLRSLVTTYDNRGSNPRQAYEQVLLDAIAGDRALFVTSGEVLASWRIVQPVLDAWAAGSEDLVTYKPGTAGPLMREAA